jgi:hypothetical protein
MAKEDWKTITEQSLINAVGNDQANSLWAAFEASKQAYLAYKAERQEFEAMMQKAFKDKMPTGMELKFGYMFGKLSIAIGPVSDKAKAQPKAESESLGDWLAGQASAGRSC